jgi:hypothetical protein
MPKTFQSNTIVPEKGLMVEDDEDEELTMARGLPGGEMQMRIQVEQLELKVDDLEGQLREKSSLLEKAQSSTKDRDSVSIGPRVRNNRLIVFRLQKRSVPNGKTFGRVSKPKSKKPRT